MQNGGNTVTEAQDPSLDPRVEILLKCYHNPDALQPTKQTSRATVTRRGKQVE